MSDFTVKSEHVDVEQIMRRIRGRIREKRGADYTDQEIRELANVKLDKFLDPKNVRSDLVAHYRERHQPTPLAPAPENVPLQSIFFTGHRGLAVKIRRWLHPILKLFMNPAMLTRVVETQHGINEFNAEQFRDVSQRFQRRDELDALNFEVVHNLVVEMTRLSIEVKNLKMRLESFATRLDFDERRARALESVVQYRPDAAPSAPPTEQVEAAADEGGDAASRLARRRRRRRGRKRGPGGPGGDGGPAAAGGQGDGADDGPGADAGGADEADASDEQ